MTPNVWAVVVSYHPDLAELADCLRRAAKQVSRVAIVVNDTDELMRRELERVVGEIFSNLVPEENSVSVQFFFPGSNVGLSRAYNLVAKEAVGASADFLLLLDQDSRLQPGAVRALLNCFDRINDANCIGAVSCRNQETIGRPVWLQILFDRFQRAREERLLSAGRLIRNHGYCEISLFKNSGTLIPVPVLTKTGLFDETLFLDAIDTDYSLRLHSNGLKIIQVEGAGVVHRQGSPLRRKVFGRELVIQTYPPMRSYFIVRDTLRMARKWWRRFPGQVSITLFGVFGGVAGSLWLLPSHGERARRVVQALFDVAATAAN